MNWRFIFGRVPNSSNQRLLLPSPAITNLVFADTSSGRQAKWFTSLMVSSNWSGFTLAPDEQRDVSFAVRPCSVKRPAANNFRGGDDYARWCAELSAATYPVHYSFTVDHTYFDGDSHWRFPQLEGEADRQSATPWTGTAQSNVITINLTPQPKVA